jgi:RimJ/RimL family protein N-acetyltransferase
MDESPVTARLRLVPIGPENAADYWLVHHDPAVIPWYNGWRPSREEAEEQAGQIAESWRAHGVHKWMAYDCVTGEVVGRGGLSRTPINDDWRQLYAFLPPEPWVGQAYDDAAEHKVHAHWLEIGWALRSAYWGQGYAAEIGAAGLLFAFDHLHARAVVSCTLRHNRRSRAVMARIGMRYVGEIYSPGIAEGEVEERDDAPYAVCVLTARNTPPPR